MGAGTVSVDACCVVVINGELTAWLHMFDEQRVTHVRWSASSYGAGYQSTEIRAKSGKPFFRRCCFGCGGKRKTSERQPIP